MKKLMVVLMALLLSGQVMAEEEKQEAQESFFDSLRKKIEMLTPKKELKTAKAVGGVRGAQADADQLYWKGEQEELVIDADELASFDQALTLIEEGDLDAAGAALNAFLEAYPDSRLREDAQQAVVMLQAEATALPSGADEEGSDVAVEPATEAEPDAQ